MNPNQAVFARPVAQAGVEERLGFLQRVYGWMTAALIVTAAGAAISIQSGITQRFAFTGFFGMIVTILMWVGLAWLAQKVRHTPTVNVIAFAAYALFTGFVVSGLVFVAMLVAQGTTGDSMTYVYQALGLTVLTFGGLTTYTFFTKRDFSFLRGLLFVGLIGLIGAGLLNALFFHSSVMAVVGSAFGVVLFSGYILYDTQKIIRTYPSDEHVAGAMTLFLDFVLLFMHILRLITLLAGSRD